MCTRFRDGLTWGGRKSATPPVPRSPPLGEELPRTLKRKPEIFLAAARQQAPVRCLEFPLLPAVHGCLQLLASTALPEAGKCWRSRAVSQGQHCWRWVTSTTEPAVPRLLPAPDLQSTLHCTEPGCDTHQGPLVPQATSCSCPTGPRQGAGRAKDGSRPPTLSPRHGQSYAAVWQLFGHTAWSPGAAVGDAGAQGLIAIPFQQNHSCKAAGGVSAGPAGGQQDSGLPQRLFLIRSPVLKKLIIRVLSIN